MKENKIKPQALIFDFGGTLDTNGVHWSEKYWDGYCSANVQVEKKRYEKAYVAAGDKMLEGIVTPGFSFRQTIEAQVSLQLNNLIADGSIEPQKKELYLKTIVDFCYSDVKNNIGRASELLEQLHKKYPMALVSNFYGNMEKVLSEFGIKGFFSAIIDSAVIGIRKPDPAIFSAGVQKLNCDASAVVVIGDSYDRDIEPASKAGCITVWLKGRSWKPLPDGPLANFTINNLQELNSILEF